MSSMHVMDLWNIAWDNNDIFIYQITFIQNCLTILQICFLTLHTYI